MSLVMLFLTSRVDRDPRAAAAKARRPEHRMRTARVLSALGTTLEWYDFMLYLFLAPVIGRLFFPTTSHTAALLATYGVFAVSFVIRPIGGLFFGRLGDRLGRKRALTASVSLMIVPMVAIGVMPTWGTIGLAAPIILIIMRLIQGFSAGGEFSGTLVLMNESADAGRRGFSAGIAQGATGVGLLMASGMTLLLQSVLGGAQMAAYGWRIAFLIGAAIGIVALVMRVRMADTPAFTAALQAGQISRRPVLDTVRRHPRQVLTVFALTGFAGVAGYTVATWLPVFLKTTIHADAADVLLAATAASALHAVLCPIAGRVADRHGRKPVMAASAVGLALLSYPLFGLVASTSFVRVLVGSLALMTLATWYLGGFSATIAELFPTRTRFSGVSLGYNLGTAVFSGTTPLVATLLVSVTGWTMAPSLYVIGAAVLVLGLLCLIPETGLPESRPGGRRRYRIKRDGRAASRPAAIPAPAAA